MINVGKIILAALLVFVFTATYAQKTATASGGTVSGKVVDSLSSAPIDYATITLLQNGDSKPVNGATTDKSGRFLVNDLKAGAYTLIVESIGYEPFTINSVLLTKDGESIDLKTILLVKKQITLQTVTVTATGKLIDNKIDKLVYNAERDITSQSGVATDILRKVPQVSVDVNGNVELAGSSSVRFLINGKPSAAFGSNITDVLQSIPASQIKSIEVVTNPGAKYDAQGLGGIINIILKKSMVQGVNGNVSLAVGTRAENGSLNFNARKGKFGMNAFVSGNLRPAFNTPYTTDRTSVDTTEQTMALLHQEGISHFTRHGFQSGVGFDWTYKEKNNFTGALSYDRFGNKGNGAISQSQLLQKQTDGSIVSEDASLTNTSSAFDFYNVDASLNYKRTFAKEDQELEISANTSLGTNHTSADNFQTAMPAQERFYGNNSINTGKENETEVQIDYTQPLKEDVVLGVGTKFNNVDITSNANVLSFQKSSQTYLPDPFLSNALRYHQKVYAVYTELSLPVGKLFDAKVGGRYERTEINSFYSDAQQQATTPGYNTFVPSVFFSRKLEENQLLKLSYSKRIERPDYGDLNPFINTSDPKNITSGNPYLLPEVGHRIELGYSRDFGKTGSLIATLFYRINNNDIQPFIRYYAAFNVGDSTYTNVAVTTRQNIGTEKNAGVNLFGDLHITSELSVRTNLFFFQRHTINTQDKGYNSNSFNYRFNANANYQFSNSLVAELFGNFNSPRHEAQGRYPSFTTYSMAVRKQFWNKKGSVALTAVNPFNKYVTQKTAVFGPNFLINTYRQVPFRSFGINFTWKFGKLEFKKEPEVQENMAAQPDSQ